MKAVQCTLPECGFKFIKTETEFEKAAKRYFPNINIPEDLIDEEKEHMMFEHGMAVEWEDNTRIVPRIFVSVTNEDPKYPFGTRVYPGNPPGIAKPEE